MNSSNFAGFFGGRRPAKVPAVPLAARSFFGSSGVPAAPSGARGAAGGATGFFAAGGSSGFFQATDTCSMRLIFLRPFFVEAAGAAASGGAASAAGAAASSATGCGASFCGPVATLVAAFNKFEATCATALSYFLAEPKRSSNVSGELALAFPLGLAGGVY